jgi:hypothetical protein
METKLTRLCLHMGLDATPGKVRVRTMSTDPPMVEVSDYDVSYSDILTHLRSTSIVGVVTVFHGSDVLGSIVTPKEKQRGSNVAAAGRIGAPKQRDVAVEVDRSSQDSETEEGLGS